MKIDKSIPFYANTSDNTHCFQAAVKMVVKYFWPEREYSWNELDTITAKVEGLWTWPMAGLLWLQTQGMEIRNVEIFDYEKFIKYGGSYLIDEFGEEMGKAQIKHSDIEQERRRAAEFIRLVTITKEIPTIELLRGFLKDDYVVICNINSHRLNDTAGYAGHSVVIKGFDENNFLLHDPGLLPLENR